MLCRGSLLVFLVLPNRFGITDCSLGSDGFAVLAEGRWLLVVLLGLVKETEAVVPDRVIVFATVCSVRDYGTQCLFPMSIILSQQKTLGTIQGGVLLRVWHHFLALVQEERVAALVALDGQTAVIGNDFLFSLFSSF